MKFSLNINDEQTIELPYVHRFRHVAPAQSKSPSKEFIDIWAEVNVDDNVPHTSKLFYIVSTWERLPSDGIYVGTAVMPNGQARHIFWTEP